MDFPTMTQRWFVTVGWGSAHRAAYEKPPYKIFTSGHYRTLRHRADANHQSNEASLSKNAGVYQTLPTVEINQGAKSPQTPTNNPAGIDCGARFKRTPGGIQSRLSAWDTAEWPVINKKTRPRGLSFKLQSSLHCASNRSAHPVSCLATSVY